MEPPQTRSAGRRRWVVWTTAVAVTLALIGLTATTLVAGPAEPISVGTTESREVPTYHDGRIVFPRRFAERAGLHAATVEKRRIVPTIEATGTVDFSPHKVAAVGARIFGRVVDVQAVVGQPVQARQVLGRLESAELGKAQAELLTLRARADLAEAEDRRKTMLVDEGIAAKRSAEVTANELRAVKAQERAAAKHIRSMGGVPNRQGSLGELTMRSPIDGEVVRVDVHRGQAIEPSHTAFLVADLSELWVELAVFEKDLPRISVGDRVQVQARGDAELLVPGTVEHIASVLDPITRTATVRVVIDNAARGLRVGQSVTGRIEGGNAGVTATAVPRKAVVLVDGRPTVFVLVEPGQVEPRVVTLGVTGGREVEIASGLEEGERVIVEGVFALKSELFR